MSPDELTKSPERDSVECRRTLRHSKREGNKPLILPSDGGFDKERSKVIARVLRRLRKAG